MEKQKNIMVCVTQQKTCERLIMSGYSKKRDGDKLHIINVVNENENFLYNISEAEALEYLFGVSKEAGADLMVIRSEDVIKAMADFVKKENITHVILGASPKSTDENSHPIAKKLKKQIEDIEFIIV